MNFFIPNKDFDGDQYVRIKNSSEGYTFQARSIEFETSMLGSIHNEKYDGTDWGDATIKFYDVSDVELTIQGDIDTDCVKTVVDWEPLYDFDLIGGSIHTLVPCSSEFRLYCVAVPDIPEGSGGSKVMINGINMNFQDMIEVDGRTSKHMVYDATNHTNKMRKIIKHDAGKKCRCELIWEHFKG